MCLPLMGALWLGQSSWREGTDYLRGQCGLFSIGGKKEKKEYSLEDLHLLPNSNIFYLHPASENE